MSARVLGLLLLGACNTSGDLHTRMVASSQPPSGLQQTQLAHIGHIDTRDGRFEVALQRLVATGMLAPRGQLHLLLFAPDGTLKHDSLVHAEPLWCEGGTVYFFGSLNVGDIEVDPDLAARFDADAMPVGNAIDFSRGIGAARIVSEFRYGSSGGIADPLPGGWPR